MTARRAPRAAVVASLACVGLVACASVPSSGPVGRGPVVEVGQSAQFVRVIAAPPSVGATPVDIVSGFLVANASLESDHAIARRFLTSAAAERWDPSASTTVYASDSLVLTEGPGGSVTAAAELRGSITPEGTLEPLEPVRQRELDFRLQLVVEGGSGVPQWRIANPRPGVLISDVDLGRAFRAHQLYHPSMRSAALVPETRYLPVTGASLPTALVGRLLGGPPRWLDPAVREPAPRGTSLSVGAVPVDDGVAVVDLSEQVRAADDRDLRDLAAQLTWTLLQVPGVQGVRLLAGGEPFPVPGAPEVMDRSVWQERSPDVLTVGPAGLDTAAYYLLRGASLLRVSGSDRTALESADLDLASTQRLAISLDRSTAAVVPADRRGMWTFPISEGARASFVRGREVSGASFDVDGWAWYADDGRVLRVLHGGEPQLVTVDREDVAGSVTSVRLARDGARVVLVADGLLYLGVIRSVAGRADVTSVRRLADDVTGVSDVAWRDSTTLDVIGSLQDARPQAVRVPVGGGPASSVGSPAGGEEIAGAPGAGTLLLVRPDQLFVNLGLQWGERGVADSVAYPG